MKFCKNRCSIFIHTLTVTFKVTVNYTGGA